MCTNHLYNNKKIVTPKHRLMRTLGEALLLLPAMQPFDSLLTDFTQNDTLPIRIVSPSFGHLSPEVASSFGLTHRTPYYFFVYH